MTNFDQSRRPDEERYAAVRDQALKRTADLNRHFQSFEARSRIAEIQTVWRGFLNQIVELNEQGHLPTQAQVDAFTGARTSAEVAPRSDVYIPTFTFAEDEYFLVLRELEGRFAGTDIFQHELEHHIAFQQEGIPSRFMVFVGMRDTGRTYYSYGVSPDFPEDMPIEEVRRIMLFAANATTQKGKLDQQSIQQNKLDGQREGEG